MDGELKKKIDTFKWSPKGATIKSGKKAAWSEAISSYPIKLNGYNDFFDNVFKLRTKVHLNSNVNIVNLKKKIFKIQNKTIKFDIVVSTVSPHIYLKINLVNFPILEEISLR